MTSRLLVCAGSLILCSACAPTIAVTDVPSDPSTDPADEAGDDGEGTLGDGTTDDPNDPADEEEEEEEEEEEDPGFAFAGEYFGEMLVMIAWPDWGGGETWDELCENGGQWSVDDDGDLSGVVGCEIFFEGEDPVRLDVELSGAVGEDGDIGGALFYEVSDWVEGSAEFDGSMLGDEMTFNGETEVDLGWIEAPVTFEFDGGRR